MTIHDIWHATKTIGKRAWSAVGASSAFVTLVFTVFYKDYLKDRDLPEWLKEFSPLITLLICVVIFSAIMLASKLISAWREKNGHVHVGDHDIVTYYAHTYHPGSDLLKLSGFAHRVFEGDTMKPEIVQYAVRIGAATGLRLTNAHGENVGFLDAFHFTEEVMKKWKNGDVAETDLSEEHFRKIPAKGQTLELAMGAIYLKPGLERGVAHQFANLGELFLRKSFPKFRRINLYATIFKPDGGRIADLYKFGPALEAAYRTGRHANGHDLRVRIIDLEQIPHQTGGVGGQKHVVIELKA